MASVTHLTNQSQFVQSNAAFAGTNASGTIASNGLSVSVNPQTAFVFSNSNGVSFGTNGSTVTATVQTNYLTTAALSDHSHGVSFTSGSVAFRTLSFTNSNGISFNSGTQGIFGSHNAITTGALSDHSHGNPQLNLTNLSGTAASNSAGFTLSLSAAAPGAGGGFAAQGSGAYTQNTGTIQFANSNGITFGLSTNQMTASHNGLTTARASNDAIGLGTALTAGPLAWTANSAGLSLNAESAAGTTSGFAGANISGSITHNTAGINLSLSVAAPGGGAGATLSHYSPPWAVSGRATNSSLGNNTLYFQPFDLPYYLSASRLNIYISISGALSAANSTGSCWQRASYGLYSQDSAGASTQSIRLITSYAITHLSHTMNSNTQYAATHYFGLSDATSHSTKQTALSTSNATTYLATNLNGGRVLAFPLNSTMSPGRYWLAFGNATTAGNAMTNGISVQMTSVGLQPEIRPFGQASAATNASVFRAYSGWGSYSATTAAYPSLVALSTDNIRHGVAMTQIHFDILGIATSTNQI